MSVELPDTNPDATGLAGPGGGGTDVTKPVPFDPRRCVVIPSYNSGPLLEQTVRAVLAVWQPVIVVIDGTTDGGDAAVIRLARNEPGLHVLAQNGNTGKGAAVFAAFHYAVDRGFTHAAVFDADGQHDPADLPEFMETARRNPLALVMGVPVFGDDAPAAHVLGHRLADFLVMIETLCRRPGDSLFGLRVYPVLAAIAVLRSFRGGRRFDFDTQMAVRLPWLGVPVVRLGARVHYPRPTRIRHFRYLRDNLLLTGVHTRLLLQAPFVWPGLLRRRLTGAPPHDAAKQRG